MKFARPLLRPVPQAVSLALLSCMATLGFYVVAAPAQVMRNHNSNAPVDFSAAQIEIQDRADRVVLSGGVSVTQAGLNIRSARMTIAYTNEKAININRIDATGGVVITKGDQRATGDVAIYDLDSRLITLVGHVTITEGANRLSGGRVVIDLNSGRSTIDGRASGGDGGAATGGGRVSGTFTVPQRK